MRIKSILCYGIMLLFPFLLISAPQDATKGGIEVVQSPPLNAIPSNALMIVQVKGIEGTLASLNEFVKNAVPDAMPLSENFIVNGFLEFLRGRKLNGLAPNGPHFFAAMEFPQPNQPANPNKVLAAIKVSNYNAFREGVLKDSEIKSIKLEKNAEVITMENGSTLFFIPRKDQVLVTPDRDIANLIAKRPTPITTKISRIQAARLQAPDLGIFVNLEAIHKDHPHLLKETKKDFESSLKNLESFFGTKKLSGSDIISQLVALTFKGLEDSNGMVFSIDFRPTGIVFHGETEFKANTQTAAFFKGSKPDAMKEMKDLPAGRTLYMAQQTQSPIMKNLASYFMGLTPEENQKALGKDFEMFLQLANNRYDALSFPPEGLQIIQSENAEETKIRFLNLLEKLGQGEKFQNAVLKQAPKIKKGAESLKGQTFDLVTFEWDLEKITNLMVRETKGNQFWNKFQKLMIKKMTGDKMNLWVTATKKEVILVTGEDWGKSKSIFEDFNKNINKLEKISHYSISRKDLPQESSLTILLDPLYYIKIIHGVLKEVEGTPVTFDLTGYNPTFIGFSAVFEEDRAAVDYVISAASVQEIYFRLIKQVGGR
ncbi:MAG: hypothetical protein EBT92_12850 [Planctomycetes bacterium]|nr:hypothetical protein [Planctomycetota bacterium]